MANEIRDHGAFTAVKWEDHSSVDVGFQVAPVRSAEQGKLLRVCFSGNYGYGSAGNRDATYMDAMFRAADEVLHPEGVILDFSVMAYQWGDMLGKVLNVPDRWRALEEPPFAIVEGADCKGALRSLLVDDLDWDASSLDWIFEDVDQAREFVELRITKNANMFQLQLDRKRDEAALAFWKMLGEEIGPERCRSAACTRLRIKDSVLCRIHHFEQIQHSACPFS